MIVNIILGLIPPWILGVILYRKKKAIVLTIAPFASAISFIINTFGFLFGFWNIMPVRLATLAGLPYDIGLYAICPCYMVYLVLRKKWSPTVLVIVFSLATTIFEYILYLLRWIIYGNGWTIGWTFISYLIPYTACYWFCVLLKNKGVLSPAHDE